ncbi:MAG: DegV family protein [Betaproteobacteria bacterium]|uniref:DegV family protein n=1 Tax=Candidatus Proximibacter danicus TaxID=2954365 RepID=A0A9D7PPP4_9PROT|nr:DegV family protein [Candidatus Proximibacter danicus]MBK9444813.1 DegV family protein [Betaproteobacteria bacterium]
MRIGVVVDSCCDLPKDFIDAHGVVVMPITLRIGDVLVEDRRDPAETHSFYTKYLDKKSEDFAESIPYSVQQIEKLFLERLVLDFDYVFCLTITSGRSQIYDHAMQASRAILTKYKEVRRQAGVPERFGLAVLSSRNMFAGQAVQAAEAIRLIRQGGTPSEIGSRLRQLVEQTHTYMVPADLFHIYKRASKKGDKSIGWGSYALGSMLDVKPILHCHQDATGPVDKVRGFDSGVERLFTKAADRIRRGLEAPYVCISYGGPLADVPKLPGHAVLEQAARENGVEILLSPMSKTAAVNVGPGAVTLAFAASGQPLH